MLTITAGCGTQQTCSFCDHVAESQHMNRSHSLRCLTDIDDVLLISFQSEGRGRHSHGRPLIYRDDTCVEDMTNFIQNEICSRLYNCDKCDYGTNSITSFTDHNRVRHLGKLFSCTKCNRTFYNRQGFARHKKESHGTPLPEVPCEMCGRVFKNKKLMLQHKARIHDPNRQRVPCKDPNCTQTFSHYASRNRHVKREHEGGVAVQCPHCQNYYTQFAMKRHIATFHTPGGMKFSCAVCALPCYSRGDAKRHEMTHNDAVNKIIAKIPKRKQLEESAPPDASADESLDMIAIKIEPDN